MPKGQLKINNVDVYEKYGISMDNNALSTLMTPPALKNWVTNEVREEHGTQYLIEESLPRYSKRDLSLTFNLVASNEDEFFSRYAAFCTEILATGIINICTKFQPNIVYRCVYESCSQFTQFRREMAQFQLKITEINPSDRAL